MDEPIELTRVNELLAQLKLARAAHAKILARGAAETTKLQNLTPQLDAAARRLRERETQMAISSEIPEGALPEELEIEHLGRQSRIVTAGIAAIEREAVASKLGVDSLVKQLQSAHDAYGALMYHAAAEQYREAAQQLRDVVCEQLAWLAVFSAPRYRQTMPYIGLTIAVDVETGKAIVDSRDLDRSPHPKSTLWYRTGEGCAELYDSILALSLEVQAALQGRDLQPRVSPTPAAA